MKRWSVTLKSIQLILLAETTSELRLRKLPLIGSIKERRHHLKEFLKVEQKLDIISIAISQGEEGKEAALFFFSPANPCILHLENRVTGKIITLLLCIVAGSSPFLGARFLVPIPDVTPKSLCATSMHKCVLTHSRCKTFFVLQLDNDRSQWILFSMWLRVKVKKQRQSLWNKSANRTSFQMKNPLTPSSCKLCTALGHEEDDQPLPSTPK